MKQVSGNLVDVYSNSVFPATISMEGNTIVDIRKDEKPYSNYILPGLIDSHVHIESSMLVPSEFSKIAIQHGTVATVSDPHEIANVLGIAGVRFMIENGRQAALKFFWSIPSCVPATTFETSGASLTVHDMASLVKYSEVVALAEMMNFPGVIYEDPEVLAKIQFALGHHLSMDGHAPGLSGDSLSKYIGAGITTDHECSTIEEATEKIQKGMKILIRNGSSAKNFDALAPLINLYPDKVMLCCDDLHPDDLLKGHINLFLKKGIEQGLDLFNLVRAASLNAIQHYNLKVGALQVGHRADFCIADNLTDFNIMETWIEGEMVYSHLAISASEDIMVSAVNNFNASTISSNEIKVLNKKQPFKAIEVIDGELLTKTSIVQDIQAGEFLQSDAQKDVLKIVVLNRYIPSQPTIGFIKGFGLKQGAIAGSVAHDSHNIIAVGVDDTDIVRAINLLVEQKGGIVVVDGADDLLLPLPIAGLLSSESAERVASMYERLDKKAKDLGSTLTAPFMTMSFMALLVIPELKIGDKGLFDGQRFEFTSLYL